MDEYNNNDESKHPWEDSFSNSIDSKVREELNEVTKVVRMARAVAKAKLESFNRVYTKMYNKKEVKYESPGIFSERLKDNYKNLETITGQ